MRREMEIEVASIIEGENGRSDYGSTEELRQLGESLRVRQLQNIWLTAAMVVIIGYRRVRAAKAVGLKTLRATVTDEKLSPSEIKVIQLTEDCHRQDWKPADRARACVELLKLNPAWQQKDLAAYLKLDSSMVTRLLSASKCIPAVQEAFEAGRLGITDCYAIHKVSEQEQHEMLAAKLNGSSRDELERSVRVRRNGTSSVKVSRLVIPLTTGYTVTISGAEVGFDEALASCAFVVKEGHKAAGQGLDVKTFARVMADKAKGKP